MSEHNHNEHIWNWSKKMYVTCLPQYMWYLHQTAQFYCPPKTASNGITVDAATINIDARQIKIGFRLIFQIEQATGHEIKLSGNTYNASFFNVQLYVVDSIIPKHIYAIDNSKKSVL